MQSKKPRESDRQAFAAFMIGNASDNAGGDDTNSSCSSESIKLAAALRISTIPSQMHSSGSASVNLPHFRRFFLVAMAKGCFLSQICPRITLGGVPATDILSMLICFILRCIDCVQSSYRTCRTTYLYSKLWVQVTSLQETTYSKLKSTLYLHRSFTFVRILSSLIQIYFEQI